MIHFDVQSSAGHKQTHDCVLKEGFFFHFLKQVVIPLHQLRAANPSVSKMNPAEKYIQIVSVEGHEFWFMGFLMYDKAAASLQEALASARELQP